MIERSHGRRHCSDRCRLQAWAKRQTGTQKALDFLPPAVALIPLAVPAHDPGKREALKRAARHILALLQDGQAHSRHELARVGGNRYVARLSEIRAALDGRAVVLGPRPYRGVRETEPMARKETGGCEMYRLRWGARH